MRSRFWLGFTLLIAGSIVATTGFAGKGSSDAEIEGKVNQLFAAYDKPDSPGCALGVVRDGAFIYKKGYGAASLELGVPLTPESVFYMGSVSKQFTAASVVLAAEQGFLSLDDDVHKYVPELPSYGKPVTLREMLHHTAGFRDIFTLLDLAGRNAEDIHPSSELIDLVARQKSLNFNPGDEFSYSNSNFFLMSVVIRRATGQPLSQFANENIFKPLGMTHTRFYDDHTLVVPGRVAAYEPRSGGGFSIGWSTNFDKVGDGGLMSSVDEMLLWDRNFYDNKLGRGTLLKELQTKGVLNNGKQIGYGLGLFISKYRGLPVVGHSGALFGYRTQILRFPQQKFSVICLCNLSTSQPLELADNIADIYLADQLEPEPATPSATNVDPRPFAGQYRDLDSHSVVKVSASKEDVEMFGEHFKPRDASHFVASFGEIAFDPKQSAAMQMTLAFKDQPPQIFEKYQPINPTAEELASFAGQYASAELEVTYKIAVKDGKLTLTKNWQDPAVLEPIVRDEFHAPDGVAIVFRHDSAGRVTACEVFAGRVRKMLFTRTLK
jgi:CubicO group peptidase (beta-lactamase class C family)